MMGQSMVDVLVVGAGPAGLAAAAAARIAGAESVVVVERERYAGGVLPQCVHDGFGLHLHRRSMTGPEYACLWEHKARAAGAEILLSTSVLSIRYDDAGGVWEAEVVGEPAGGHARIFAYSVVVATGCRERTRGALGIPGTRPAGVMTAGTAQYMMNVKNQLPGDKVVILGSGDIGLIVARRLALEGADIRLVLGQEATGLLRNHIRCIDDFHLPIRYGWGILRVHGQGQIKGVSIAPFKEDGSLDAQRREYIRCNLLLLACGLIPEREILPDDADASEGIYLCGNVNEAHDLVDAVTQEGLSAGVAAAAHALHRCGREAAAAAAPTFGLERDQGAAFDALHGTVGSSMRKAEEVMMQPLSSDEVDRMLAISISEAKGDARGASDGSIPCTVCPSGCIMRVAENGSITGNLCSRGAEHARSELHSPMRLFTGTVKLHGGSAALLPVRTSSEIRRDQLMAVARRCRRICVPVPVRVGQVVSRDVAGTGADLVACSNAPALSCASAEGACL